MFRTASAVSKGKNGGWYTLLLFDYLVMNLVAGGVKLHGNHLPWYNL